MLETVAIVGREREIADVESLAERSRLVTITGPGGIGKTRLAAEVAGAGARPGERVAFVDLAPIADPALIADAVARAAGVEFDPPGDPVEALASALRLQHLLVVLDSCEHLVAACAKLVEAVAREGSGVRFIATSREPLGIAAETVYRLEPLDERASMTLFTELALRADPDFAPGETEMPVLRHICKRLDGIALAIALAASYVSSLTLGQLRSRLDGHFRLLIGENQHDAPIRHKTLDALIDWSYDTFSQPERTVFRRLGTFTDSFTREAAVAIVSDRELDPKHVEGALDGLVAKSVLDRTGDRYRMLEPIRQYALGRFDNPGEEFTVRQRFADYYAHYAEEAAQRFGYGTQEAWIDLLAPELENFRAALDWARDCDPALGARLVTSLTDFWELYNIAAEGLRRSEAMYAGIPDPDGAPALRLLLSTARLSMIAHVYWRSFELYERAFTLAVRFDDRSALAEARRIGARARRILGIVPERCLDDLRAALEIVREEGNPYRIARTLVDYGFELIDTGDPARGRIVLREAEERTAEIGWPHLSAHLQINLAELEFRTGDIASAARRGRELVAMLRPRGSTAMIVLALTNLASYLSVLGEDSEAYATAREAVEAGIERDMRFCVVWALQAAGLALARRGEIDAAAKLLGYVDQNVEFTGSKREPTELYVEELIVAALRGVAEERWVRERAGGRMMTEAEAVALAFGQRVTANESESTKP
ncbi:MAG: hypothetical protein JOY98_05520 [Candidatus Eremiobacteraeota bacterium]|nr:hypothetical protein [Candidatus Eremiobacteraeota bacterium]